MSISSLFNEYLSYGVIMIRIHETWQDYRYGNNICFGKGKEKQLLPIKYVQNGLTHEIEQ